MPDRLQTENIKKELADMLFNNVNQAFYGGFIDENQFNEYMDEIDSIQDMSFEELHQLFDLIRSDNK